MVLNKKGFANSMFIILLIIAVVAVGFYYSSTSDGLVIAPLSVDGYENFGEPVYIGKSYTLNGEPTVYVTETCEVGIDDPWLGKCIYFSQSPYINEEKFNPEHNDIYNIDGVIKGSCSGGNGYADFELVFNEGQTFNSNDFSNENDELYGCTHIYRQELRIVDLDGDGVLNVIDECVDVAGTESNGCPPTEIPAPNDPLPFSLTNLFNIIKTWIADFLDSLPFTIVGSDVTNVDELYISTITLTSPILPDSNYIDGDVTKLYGVVYVADKDGNFLFQGTQSELMATDTYSKSVTYTPVDTGKIVIGGVIVSTSTTYDYANQVWNEWSDPEIVVSEEKVVEVIGVPSAPTEPNFNIFASITNWIKSLFCNTFGFLCSS